MKKIKSLLIVSIIMVCLSALVACSTKEYKVTFETNGGSSINPVYVVEGGKVEKPADPTKQGYSFVSWFEDEELSKEFDFSQSIQNNVTVYAKWEVKTPQYDIFVNGVSQRNEFVEYETNKQVKDNKRSEFMDLTQPLMVGDDNVFVVMPEVQFIEVDVDNKIIVNNNPYVESWEYDITVFEITEAEEVKLAADSNLIDAIDDVNCTVDFSEEAVGKQFKVTVCPRKLTEKQLANVEKYTTSVVCDVKDGYNVYNALEFGYIENRSTSDSDAKNAWDEFKQAKGLDVNYHPSALFLQGDISITSDDVPSYFFWQESEVKGASDEERALGSMKDFRELYRKELTEGEEFGVYGNYFTLDIMNIKEVVRERDNITPEGEVISHASFVKFEGAENAQATIQNVNLVGNAPRVEDSIKSGGQIFIKVEGPKFHAYNNISTGWFISYMPNYTHTEFKMEKCRAYDSYNCFVYNWGSPLVYIDSCEMIGAGGPVIIQDHVSPGKEDSSIANTYITNSCLESYVTGSEGWFKGVHADTLVPSIKGIDAAFNPFGRSFLKSNSDKTLTYLNLICVNKSGDSESLEPNHIEGSVNIDSLPAFDFGKTNPYVAALINATFGTGSATFQTDAGGCAFATQQGLADPTQSLILDPSNAIYQGDYLGMYFNGSLILLGYFNYDVVNNAYEVYTPLK